MTSLEKAVGVKNLMGPTAHKTDNKFVLPAMSGSNSGIFTTGSVGTTGHGFARANTIEGMYAKASGADVVTQPTFFYDPGFTPDIWLLPKGRAEALRWVQIHFNLNPYINSIINMHARYPFSTFKLRYKDVEIEEKFNELLFKNKKFDWYDFILQMSLSYWKYGEAIVFGDWSEADGTWNYLTLLPPVDVDYREDLFTGKTTIQVIPTSTMKNKVRDALLEGRNDIDPSLVEAVSNNRKIPLDTEGTNGNIFTGERFSPPKAFVWARVQEPGEVRGTSIITCLFKDLIFADKIRMAQMAVADRHTLPIELWTVGNLSNDADSSSLPEHQNLEDIRAMLLQQLQQPPFIIVAGPYLKYEALGVSGKLLSIYDDLGYVENQILVGLGTNKNLILSEGPSFGSSKTIALHRLIREYTTVRKLLESCFKINILLPIAKANNIVDGKGQYIIPDIAWDLSLQPEQDKEQFDIAYKLYKDGIISTMSLFVKCPFPIDYKLEMKRLPDERGTVFDKGDKRLGKKVVHAPSVVPGAAPGAAPGAVPGMGDNGKGNDALVDFALGNGVSNVLPESTELPEAGEMPNNAENAGGSAADITHSTDTAAFEGAVAQ